jgi:hypothetical protein
MVRVQLLPRSKRASQIASVGLVKFQNLVMEMVDLDGVARNRSAKSARYALREIRRRCMLEDPTNWRSPNRRGTCPNRSVSAGRFKVEKLLILKLTNDGRGVGSGWCGAMEAVLEGLVSFREVCGTNQLTLARKLFRNCSILRAHRDSTPAVEGDKADWTATGIPGEVSV